LSADANGPFAFLHPLPPNERSNAMNLRSIRALPIAGALIALAALFGACTATDPRLEDEIQTPTTAPTSTGERVILTSGANVTLPADQSVDLYIVYNGHARIEGHAGTIAVVNGTADLVGSQAGSVVAIQSQVQMDDATRVSGDVRTYDSTIIGADGTTVSGRIRDLGPDIVFGWANFWAALLLVYVAFAVSALVAGVILAGLAGRQLRAATALIRDEPLMVVGAGFVGFVALITVAVLAIVTVVGIPFGLGLLALVLPGLFLVGYIVSGIWVGEWILGRTGAPASERPFKAAIIGLVIVGLVGFIPMVGGVIAFIGFGAVMLLAWRVLRQAPATASGGVGRSVVEPAS